MALYPAAYGMYAENVPLNDVVHTLNQAGFDNEDICMMLSPTHPIAHLVRDASLFNSEREANAATAGLIGWLSEFGAVMIPTVGFFIRSQAFFHALMVARDTPAFCGNPNTLVGLGFSDDEADRLLREREDILGLRGAAPHRRARSGHFARDRQPARQRSRLKAHGDGHSCPSLLLLIHSTALSFRPAPEAPAEWRNLAASLALHL
jgi:hypothetical protein